MTAANRILRSYGERITIGTAEGRGFISCIWRKVRYDVSFIVNLPFMPGIYLSWFIS